MGRGRIHGATGGALAAIAVAGAVASVVASCQSTPTTVPLRTFERPQKVATICLGLYDSTGKSLPLPVPLPVDACPPVPPNVDGTLFHNHLYALVTQQTRGQLALVDLTQEYVVDEDHSTPGVNFIPVGADPTDVAVAPDATMTFVASADPNAWAIYGIPSGRLLGDTIGTSPLAVPLGITDLSTCRLPQPPQALGILPLASPAPGMPSYVIVAILRAATGGGAARVATIDPRPFAAGGDAGGPPALVPGVISPCALLGETGLTNVAANAPSVGATWPDGVPYADASDQPGDYPPLSPSCPAAAGDAGAPSGAGDGATGDGASAGDDAAISGEAGDDAEAGSVADAAPIAIDASPLFDGGVAVGSDAGGVAVPPSQALPKTLVVRDDAPVVYIADGMLPIVHVFAFDGSGNPSEVGQYVATSVANPTRSTNLGAIALSPITTDQRRYLYAVDKGDNGSIVVFDATSPVPGPGPGTPLRRPHPALNPFQEPDRIVLTAPVTSLAFAAHDWPVIPPQVCAPGGACSANPNTTNAFSGLLCNPNINAIVDGGAGFVDAGIGGYYRADFASQIQPQGSGMTGFPSRLRGVFAFATTSNGNVVTIDVDDWDAPCRRPDPMAVVDKLNPVFGSTGQLDLPEPPPSGPNDLDPYHAPVTANPNSGTTQESFFPVSAPNRVRSSALLRDDPTVGNHQPNVTTTPSLFDSTGAPFSGANGSPFIAPTALDDGRIDPTFIVNPTATNLSYSATPPELESAIAQNASGGGTPFLLPVSNAQPRVRVSFDDPTAHIDQDWTVTYEGAIPSTNGMVGYFTTSDGYNSITLSPSVGPVAASASNGAQFCSRGIEDWNVGKQRVAQLNAAMTAVGLRSDVPGADRSQWTSDYIEIIDDLLASTDPYWESTDAGEDCWDGVLASQPGQSVSDVASSRYNYCLQVFGTKANDDATYSRDFPIVQATDNALTLGRFGWPQGTEEQTTNRTIVGPSPTNVFFLKQAACCFHKQVSFKVRTGGEWATVGAGGLGFFNHVQKDPNTGACVLPCDDSRFALMNARTFELPPPACAALEQTQVAQPYIPRNSPLAMRNPMFSFVMWSGCPPTVPDGMNLPAGPHIGSARDLQWRFSLRGGFTPLTINLGGTTAVPVAPESLLYVPSFGQLAVVDGEQQGLVMIDINTLGFAHAPYF